MIHPVTMRAWQQVIMQCACGMAALLCALAVQAQLAAPRSGMHISTSVKLAPGIYKLNNGQSAVIEIEGNDIAVDFNHAELDGNSSGALPDGFTGIAINIISGKNITIKNLTVRGYKVALMAKDIKGLIIEHCNFSYNYRQHLNSTQQKEDLSDWMSYHHNENDEWLRYGAAMYLRGCNKAAVHDNLVTGGQCALMLTQCDSGMIYNNDFSFNSGIGIGMYRSSMDTIMYNRLNFNVRGHSEGVYNRGQDAAAILVFEQCNKNVYAFNSATHSGDGFFLWAGQTTMDNGEGGCNDNLVFSNNFSYAPTNGIEATFSRNRISANTMVECDNGIWGGYSYNTSIISNEIKNCTLGVAIEHGQDNAIEHNNIFNCKEAVKLWGRASQPADWGYANKRDTRSRNYSIAYNRFHDNQLVFDFSRSASISGKVNDTQGNKVFIRSDTTVINMLFTAFTHTYDGYALSDPERKLMNLRRSWRRNIFQTDSPLIGRRQIRMTEWGPYDFRSPLIWNTNPVNNSDTMQFDIIGPKGNWKIVNQRGVTGISATQGAIPSVITAIKTKQKGQDIFIELEYMGDEVTTLFGEKIKKGKPYRFNYRNALLPAVWQVSWYAFDSLQNPVIHPEALPAILQQTPVQTEQANDLHYAWWNGVGKEKKYEKFVTVAESDIDFPEGAYEMGVSWEDVIRIYADGQLLLDEWKPAAHLYDESPHRELPVNLAGKHHLRVEQANQGGLATLIIKLKKK